MPSHLRRGLPLATQLCAEGGALLRNLLLARLLGVDEMGLAMLMALAMRVVEMIGALGLDRLLVCEPADRVSAVQPTLHSLGLLSGCVLALLFWVATAALLPFGPAELDPALLPVAAASFAIRGLMHLDYRACQRQGDFGPGFWVEGAPGLLSALLLLPLVLWQADHGALVWALLAQSVVTVAASQICARRPWRLGWSLPVLRRALIFGLPLMLNGAAMFAVLQGDRVVVATLLTPADLALYVVVAQCALLPALVGARLMLSIGLPRYSELLLKPAAFKRRMHRDLLAHGSIAALGICAFTLLAPALIATLFGPAFAPDAALALAFGTAAAGRLIRAVPATALMAEGRTLALLTSNLPRLAAVGVMLAFALDGASLLALTTIGAIGEWLALLATLAIRGAGRRPVADTRPSLSSPMLPAK